MLGIESYNGICQEDAFVFRRYKLIISNLPWVKRSLPAGAKTLAKVLSVIERSLDAAIRSYISTC